eukprot:1187058-Prorocentrum_minimum.AAC.4
MSAVGWRAWNRSNARESVARARASLIGRTAAGAELHTCTPGPRAPVGFFKVEFAPAEGDFRRAAGEFTSPRTASDHPAARRRRAGVTKGARARRPIGGRGGRAVGGWTAARAPPRPPAAFAGTGRSDPASHRGGSAKLGFFGCEQLAIWAGMAKDVGFGMGAGCWTYLPGAEHGGGQSAQGAVDGTSE